VWKVLRNLWWFSPTFSAALVNATVLTLLLKMLCWKEKRFSRGVLANTARFLRLFFLETSPFLAPDGITDFGVVLAKHCISLSALSFCKSTDEKPFLTEHAMTCGVNGLTYFICLWCNARIVAIGRKVLFHHKLLFVTKQRSQFVCGYLQTSQ